MAMTRQTIRMRRAPTPRGRALRAAVVRAVRYARDLACARESLTAQARASTLTAVVLQREIAAHRRTMEALRQREEQYRRLVEVAQVAAYDAARDRPSPDRLALHADLRAALAAGALTLHYQPQVDLASGRVRGVEALVRWPHPSRGLIPPDQFIPLAERTGLIGPLTEWVLAAALRQCRAWQRAGVRLSLSVNLSMGTLHDPTLPALLARLLRAHGLAPADVCLELTEGTLMADPARTRRALAALRALGVRLAVDDFGAGYSSLAYLKELPVDELKIDKGFVRHVAGDAADLAIVAATLGLAHMLGLRVVAEGVEDRAGWEQLAALGCDTAQGYYLSRPLPPEDLVAWLRAAERAAA